MEADKREVAWRGGLHNKGWWIFLCSLSFYLKEFPLCFVPSLLGPSHWSNKRPLNPQIPPALRSYCTALFPSLDVNTMQLYLLINPHIGPHATKQQARGSTVLSPMFRGYWDSALNTCRQLEYAWLTCGKVVRLCKSLCNLHQRTWMTSSICCHESVCLPALCCWPASRLRCTLETCWENAVNTCLLLNQYVFRAQLNTRKMQFCHAIICLTSCNCSVKQHHTSFILKALWRAETWMPSGTACKEKIVWSRY